MLPWPARPLSPEIGLASRVTAEAVKRVQKKVGARTAPGEAENDVEEDSGA